jgi:predicted DNA-binding transcriptional regulator YafY
MPRRDHVPRVLVLAAELQRSGRRGVALKTLAERHGWPLRNLYRDIETLEAAGYPIVHDEQRYRLDDAFRGVAGLAIDAEELAALCLARDDARAWRATSYGRALDRLWSKLTGSRGRQVSMWPEGPPWFAARTLVGIDYRQHSKTITAFEASIRGRQVVRCVYRGRAAVAPASGARGGRENTQREIEPGELYWDPGLETLYVLAYCRLRRDVRVFAVHRFVSAELTTEHFAPRPGISSKPMLRSTFRVWRGEARRVRICFRGSAAEYVRERTWHSSQRVEDVSAENAVGGGDVAGGGSGHVELTLEVAAEDELLRWILGFGADAQVMEPESLRLRVQDELRRWGQVVGEPAVARPGRAGEVDSLAAKQVRVARAAGVRRG